jgi:hypothetical protein
MDDMTKKYKMVPSALLIDARWISKHGWTQYIPNESYDKNMINADGFPFTFIDNNTSRKSPSIGEALV